MILWIFLLGKKGFFLHVLHLTAVIRKLSLTVKNVVKKNGRRKHIVNHNSNKNQKPVIEYIARITMPDGEVVEKSASTVGDFPSPEEFDLSTREGFLADFDLLEKAVLETSRKLNRKLSEEFLDSSSKKKTD